MRVYYEIRGGHVHCRVFTHGKNGDLVFGIEEWEQVRETFFSPSVAFKPEGTSSAAAEPAPAATTCDLCGIVDPAYAVCADCLDSLGVEVTEEDWTPSALTAAAECPDALLPDGPECPRCGGPRVPSGVDGGSWVHLPTWIKRPNVD